MIYQVDGTKQEVKYQEINEHHMYIGMMSSEEFKACYQELHIHPDVIERWEESSFMNQNIMIPYKNYYYGFIHLINARNVFMKKDAMSFFIFKNLFLVVIIDDEDQHIRQVFENISDYVIEQGVSITRLVYYFLNELISRDSLYLEELQEDIEELEKHEEVIQFAGEFRKLSQELLLIQNYYDHFIGIGEELQMNYYHIFEQDDMRYFDIFTNRLTRFSKRIQMLREMLNQVSVAHQSQLDYHLNKTMQFFTMVTTIFMPLTLITGWYGMNFKYMRELDMEYSYPIVIFVSIAIVFGLILLFKKKKYF